MSRFDQDPSQPYGHCVTCEITLATQQDANAHMSETFDGGKSHTTRATNLTRQQHIERAVGFEVEAAISDAIESLGRLVDRGDATSDEIGQALRLYSDFGGAWEEREDDA